MWNAPLASALMATSLPWVSMTRMATPLTGALVSASRAVPLMLPGLRVGFERAIDVDERVPRRGRARSAGSARCTGSAANAGRQCAGRKGTG